MRCIVFDSERYFTSGKYILGGIVVAKYLLNTLASLGFRNLTFRVGHDLTFIY